MKWKSNGDIAASLLSFFIFTAMFIFPGFIIFVYKKMRNTYTDTTSFSARFATVFNKLKKNDDKAKLYPIFFLIRRLIYSFVVVIMANSPVHQLLFLV